MTIRYTVDGSAPATSPRSACWRSRRHTRQLPHSSNRSRQSRHGGHGTHGYPTPVARKYIQREQNRGYPRREDLHLGADNTYGQLEGARSPGILPVPDRRGDPATVASASYSVLTFAKGNGSACPSSWNERLCLLGISNASPASSATPVQMSSATQLTQVSMGSALMGGSQYGEPAPDLGK